MKLQITIGERRYEAEIEVLDEPTAPHLGAAAQAARAGRQVAQPIAAPPADGHAAGQTAGADEHKLCRSAVMGLVVRVLVEPGQQVEAGQPLILLEAMKMESNVTAPQAGSIGKLLVAAGDSVKKGQPLIEFA